VVTLRIISFGLTSYGPAYAEKAEQESSNEAKVFNCLQRETRFPMPSFRSSCNTFTGAHQNTLENVPVVVLTWVLFPSRVVMGLITLLATYRTLISGFRYPIAAAAACGLWSITRIMYTLRYGTGEPKKVFVCMQSHPGGRNLNRTLNPARASGQIELLRPDR
jgi:uncharacterized membrane protein